MQKQIVGGLLKLVAVCLPLAAQAQTTIDLVRGHFVVSMDPSVDSYALRVVPRPNTCLPTLTMEQGAGGKYRVVSSDPACKADPYAELRINPAWTPALSILLGGGQIDFELSVWDSLSTLQASVSLGDIFGPDSVQRHRLLGARLAVDRERTGIALRVAVGSGQITLDMPARQRRSAK